MRSTEPLGHERVLAGLWGAARERRLAHALCFSGPAGAGKFLAAEVLTAGLLCARGPGAPCGECGACRRVRADSHPDVLVVDVVSEGEEEIKLQRIAPREAGEGQSVGSFLSLRAMESGWRVVLVRDAERLNEEAQNALLKTLEEPGADTLIVLVTARPDLLLPTVHSRCVRVRCAAPGEDVARRVLLAEGVDGELAQLYARWSRGAPGEALAHAQRSALEMRALVAGVASGELALAAAFEQYDALAGEFPAKTPAASARVKARAFLDLSLDVLSDLRRAAHGVPVAELVHSDLADAAWARSLPRLERALEECLRARQDVDLNLAPDAAVERALLVLAAPVRQRDTAR